ncbi:MAG: hypothetical protein AAF216_09905 [Pseudomonadota bacterium]
MPGTPSIDQTPQWLKRLRAFGDTKILGAVLALILFSLAIYGALDWNGLLPGNDDNMRLAQIRDLLAGQAWLDVNQSRFLTEAGGAMHWSRLPDLGPAALIILMSPMLGPDAAEHAALLLWPRIVLAGVLVSICYCVQRVGGGLPGMLFALVAFLTSATMVQFQPGRIDHHGFQLALILIGLAAALAPQARWKSGVLTGVCVAASVSTAIESLPYAAALVALVGAFWIARPNRRSPQLAGLGAAMLIAGGLFFAADAPGLEGVRAVCDAYGNFHFAALTAGGAALIALSLATPNIPNQTWRIGAGAGAALLVGGLAASVDPSCLASPYASVNAEAISGWMASVGEARNIFVLASSNGAFAFGIFGFCFAGIAAGGYMLTRVRPRRRIGTVGVLALLVLATLVTAWQVRGVNFAHAFAAIAVGLAASDAFRRFVERDGTERVLAVAALLVLAPTSYQALGARMLAPDVNPERKEASDARISCRSDDGLAKLAKLPSGRVFTPIDLGTAVLTGTDHSILSAPYHRNASAILNTIDIFEASPDAALDRLKALEVDYVYVCPALSEVGVYAKRAPDGFAAALRESTLPAEFTKLKSGENGPLILAIDAMPVAALP